MGIGCQHAVFKLLMQVYHTLQCRQGCLPWQKHLSVCSYPLAVMHKDDFNSSMLDVSPTTVPVGRQLAQKWRSLRLIAGRSLMRSILEHFFCGFRLRASEALTRCRLAFLDLDRKPIGPSILDECGLLGEREYHDGSGKGIPRNG